MQVWEYQYYYNGLYRSFCHLIGKTPDNVRHLDDIPFLPIVFFRDQEITTGDWSAEQIFRSSGTTGMQRSQHYIRDLAWYHSICELSFPVEWGGPQDFTWIGLLPSYLGRADSSLISMVHHFMTKGDKAPLFFPEINTTFFETLHQLKASGQQTILIGVTFALMELFQHHTVPVWDQLLVIETGGMKGRGVEITRDELHMFLKKNNPGLTLSSEYGMTELLSQAYLLRDRFQPGPAMKIMIRDVADPLQILPPEKRGAINIIDLANMDTCSFIATDDLGVVYQDGSFDVLGRLDQSDIRGCNLLYEDGMISAL